jgi:hypothetical protein
MYLTMTTLRMGLNIGQSWKAAWTVMDSLSKNLRGDHAAYYVIPHGMI